MSTPLALPAVFRFPLIAFIVIFSTGCLDGDKGSQGPAGAAGAAGPAGAAGAAGPAGPAGAGVLGFDRIDANETTSATAYGDLATAGPTAAFSLGAPGDVYVDFGAFMQVCDGSNESAFVSVSVDGSAPTDNDAVIVGQSFNDCHNASASRVLRLSLAAGAHTITLKYRTDAAVPVNFSRRWLRVTGG